jgi:siroheme synthase
MTPVVVVENASLAAQQRFALVLRDLPGIAALGITGPAVILLGEVYSALQEQAATPSAHVRRA